MFVNLSYHVKFQNHCLEGRFLQFTDTLVQGFCASILPEAEQIYERSYPSWRKDIFMEQRKSDAEPTLQILK